MLGWLCIVQSLWAYTPGVRAGAECGAAALNLLGAAPKARTLWALAKSFARCKTNIASNAKHPFTKLYSFFIFLYLFFCSCNVLTVLRRNFVGANLEPAAAALVVTPGIISRSPHKRRSIA